MINFDIQANYLISFSAAIKVNNVKKCWDYPYNFLFIFTVSSLEKRNEQKSQNNQHLAVKSAAAMPDKIFGSIKKLSQIKVVFLAQTLGYTPNLIVKFSNIFIFLTDLSARFITVL